MLSNISLPQHGLNLLFPPTCGACLQKIRLEPGLPFCASCVQGLSRIEAPFCLRCGHPQDHPARHAPPARSSQGRESLRRGNACAWCAKHQPLWGRGRCLFRYDGPIRQALLHFKYNKNRLAGRSLAQLFAEALPRLDLPFLSYDHLLPIPSHEQKIRERGFHQVYLLIELFPRTLRHRIAPTLLLRTKATAAQASLSFQERQTNLQGSFSVPLGILPTLEGKRILLVDDVLTTGATSNACAATLLAAGAASVDLLSLALSG